MNQTIVILKMESIKMILRIMMFLQFQRYFKGFRLFQRFQRYLKDLDGQLKINDHDIVTLMTTYGPMIKLPINF